MKTYNNGPRKAMMYGGAAKRKPMMYGGTAMKKPRKKAYGGGMMSTKQGQQNQMQNTMMQQPKLANTNMMAKGGKAFPDLTGDGKVDKKDILKGRGVPGFQEGGKVKTDRQMMAEDKPTRRKLQPQLPKGKPNRDTIRRLQAIFDQMSDREIDAIFKKTIQKNYR